MAGFDGFALALIMAAKGKLHAAADVGLIGRLALDQHGGEALAPCRLAGGSGAGERIEDSARSIF